MPMLIAGVIVWSIAHLFKAISPGYRAAIEEKLGENLYRGLFSLVIVGSLVLIVIGWKSAVPQAVYAAPMAGGPFISALMLLGLILFFSYQFPGNIRRHVRHPQMTGTLLWGVAHLLTNGDGRSVVLFGGFVVWALLEIMLINRRDGQFQKPAAAGIRFDIIPVAIGSVVFAALFYFHSTLFGVAPY